MKIQTGAYFSSGHYLRCASRPRFSSLYLINAAALEATDLSKCHGESKVGELLHSGEWEDCNNYGVTSPRIMALLCDVQLPRLLVDLRLGEERAGQGGGEERAHHWIGGFVCRRVLGFSSYGWNSWGSKLLSFACSLDCTQCQTHVFNAAMNIVNIVTHISCVNVCYCGRNSWIWRNV